LVAKSPKIVFLLPQAPAWEGVTKTVKKSIFQRTNKSVTNIIKLIDFQNKQVTYNNDICRPYLFKVILNVLDIKIIV